MPPDVDFTPPPEFDEYKLVRPLGRGGMGQVFLARDLALDRLVAIKFIAASVPSPAARQRFLSEARAIARLHHPNVVSVFRIGEVARCPYLVSEYVDGQGLDRLPKPLPWARALEIGVDLARGLAAAHRRGIVHRDIKPANSILSHEGQAKLLDFGLAKLLDASVAAPLPLKDITPARLDGDLARTQTGVIAADDHTQPQVGTPKGSTGRTAGDGDSSLAGTPLFMAPELFRGQPASRRSDVYSLGVVLYELVAGRHPYRRPTSLAELRQLLRTEDPAPLAETASGCPPALAAAIARCLARDPDERYDSGDELCTELERIRAGATAADLPEGNPYRGLHAFDADHRALFFGRGGEVREVLDRLRHEPFVLVAGDSGVGKSSLCRAGVLPALDTSHKIVVLPGRRPFAALVAALAPALELDEEVVAARLGDDAEGIARVLGDGVLFIDQLEELVTLADAAQVEKFADALAELAFARSELRIVATARGDFVTRLASLPGLADLVPRALFILRPLSPEGVRDAVVGPARAKGYELESEALVTTLVSAAAEPGALPLLQFTLAAMWDGRDEARRVIPARALEAIGGVGGALASHADAVIDAMLPDERTAAWRVLGRLITHEGTRAVMTRAELDEVAGGGGAVEHLVAGRLLVASEDRISVVHESLATAWPRLAAWRRANLEGARLRDQLRDAALQWDARGRPRGLLWRADALAEYRLWRQRHPDPLTAVEETFAAAGLHAARTTRRTRALLVAAAIVALAAGLVVLFRANRHAEAQVALLYEEQGRQALLAGSSAQAAVYLEEAWRRGVDTRALHFMLGRALRAVAPQTLAWRGGQGRIWSAALSPDGAQVATAGEDATIRLWDARRGSLQRTLTGHAREVIHVAFSPDGKRIVSSGTDGTLRVWDPASGATLTSTRIHDGATAAVFALSPDGRRIAVAGATGTVELLDRDGRAQMTLQGAHGLINALAWSADQSRLAGAALDATTVLWDTAGAAPPRVLAERGQRVAVAFSPDGRLLATAGVNGDVRLWDARTADVVRELIGHTDLVEAIVFSPDGARVVTAGRDRTARVWSVADGSVQAILNGHTGHIRTVVLSHDGARLLTSGRDGVARVWDARTGFPLAAFEAHMGSIEAMFDPGGETIVTAGWDGMVREWDAGTSYARVLGGGQAGIWEVSLGDSGRVVAASGSDRVRVWSLSGRSLHDLGRDAYVALQPHGSLVAVRSAQAEVEVIDERDGSVRARFDPGFPNSGMVFDPEGKLVMVTGGKVGVWEAATGRQVTSLAVPRPVNIGLLLRGGARAVLLENDGAARLWDLPGGREIRLLANGVYTLPGVDPTGRFVAVGGADRSVAVYDLDDGALVARFSGHTALVASCAFSPDGRRLVSAGQEGSARVWDLPTRRSIGSLDGHASSVTSARFSPDGNLIVTSSRDHLIRLWDAASLQLLAVLQGHQGLVVDAAFTADGAALVSGGADGVVAAWSVGDAVRSRRETRELLECRASFALVDGRAVSNHDWPSRCFP